MPFTIHTIYRQVFKIWRRKRYQLFLETVKPHNGDSLLDVGGHPGFWTEHAQPVRRIVALNVHEVAWQNDQFPDHNIEFVVGDGCALTMPDKSYEIGFSNSVIEHVGSWERQQQFASEIRRVAQALWVQTPAYECPFEPHFMTPIVHYLPRALRKKIARWFTVWGWIARPTRAEVDSMVDTTRLLRKSEMQQLFPDCTIITERMLWVLPKSYIAVRLKA